MSRAFLKQQQHQHRGCPDCGRARYRHGRHTYGLCVKHLASGRAAWHQHVRRCNRQGRCINCQRARLRGEQRCSICKERNRVRISNWVAAHPQASHRRWLLRKRRYLDSGLCPSCREHHPLPVGYRRCDSCRVKQSRKA